MDKTVLWVVLAFLAIALSDTFPNITKSLLVLLILSVLLNNSSVFKNLTSLFNGVN